MDFKEILGEELFNSVVTALKGKGKDGKDLEFVITNNGEWIPRTKYNKDVEDFKLQITERDTQLQDLAKKAKGNEELENTIKEMKKANEDTTKKLKITYELREAFIKNGAEKYFNLLSPQIKDKIEVLEDGTVKGIDEQINVLKEDYAELFKTQTQTETGREFIAGNNIQKKDPKDMDMEEYAKQWNEQNK